MTRVAVVGQGKLGFPVAAYYAHRGAQVVGIDVSERVVAEINAGRSPIGFEPGASEQVASLVAAGSLIATTSYEDASGAEVIIVLVPLLARRGEPDFTQLDAAVSAMAPHILGGALVVFETTLPVGSTRERFAPSLRGNEPQVLVAHSPERVSSGRIWRDLDTYPKLVGGVDEASARAATGFYEQYLDAEVRVLGSCETAEMTKLAEATYRDVNIAFANEMARFADDWGVDVTEVIEAANSQPYSHIHRPGVGVGGHCIPHYPHLLQWSTEGSALVDGARIINETMPHWAVGRIEKEVGPLAGVIVLVHGVAYRGGVKEVEGSPTFSLARLCEERGATVYVEDPCFANEELRAMGLRPWEGQPPAVVVFATDHLEYQDVDWSQYSSALVVDGRNVLDRTAVRRAGHRYLGIGRQ